jgi:hypothetical protein
MMAAGAGLELGLLRHPGGACTLRRLSHSFVFYHLAWTSSLVLLVRLQKPLMPLTERA